ncbi:MAG: GEVED domain-containing protein [Bacteroidaceae bacterium]|nr:GEVED domain-containing protein [Bacteroidaceae bacterium]
MLLLIAGSSMVAMAYEKIGLSFSRTGSDASSVTVNVVDQNGKPIDGVAASVSSSHTFKTTGNAVSGNLLCFDVNGNTSPTITFSVALNGLKEPIDFDIVGMDIHALNGQGNYQQNNDNVNRLWNVSMTQNDQTFSSLSDIDIAAGIGENQTSVHKFWALKATSKATVSTVLTLDFTITAGSENKGCFMGISYITIGGNDIIESKTDPIIPDDNGFGGSEQYYLIQWYGNANSYITEGNTGVLQVDAKKNTVKQYWQFLPTGNPNCYHIKNAVTGHYIEACKTSSDNTYNISATETPVEYYISKESALSNAYRLTSTNCANYDNTSKSPVGLNKNGANSYIITWAAGTSNTGSYWYINKTDFDYDYEAAEASKKHTSFAKSAQVYFMPCGSVKSTVCVDKLQLTGEGAMHQLDYPVTTWAGKKVTGTAVSNTWWTLFTTDKAQVAPGHDIQLDVTLKGIPTTGYIVQACFDWNHDGEFEEVLQVDEPTSKALTFKTTVPEDAVLGESRMRIRITDNGMTGPDEDVTMGQILDCIVVTVPYTAPEVTVDVNDHTRGLATKTEATEGSNQVICQATPVGDSKFLCWTDGKKVVSTNASYSVIPERPTHLTAMFSINTTNERPTAIDMSPAISIDEVYDVPRYYDLTGRHVTRPAKGETYIRKNSALTGEVVVF